MGPAHDEWYYAVLRQGTSLNALPRLKDQRAARQLYKREKETSSIEILYDREVWDKRPSFSKPELLCHKASTQLLTFRKTKIQSAPAQLISILFLLHRILQFLRYTRKVIWWSSKEECDLDSDSDDLTVHSDEEDPLDDFGFSSGSQNTYCWTNGYSRLTSGKANYTVSYTHLTLPTKLEV